MSQQHTKILDHLNCYNPGARSDLSPRLVNDHDFRSDSTGIAIPFGIYDLLANPWAPSWWASRTTRRLSRHMLFRIGGSPKPKEWTVIPDPGNCLF